MGDLTLQCRPHIQCLKKKKGLFFIIPKVCPKRATPWAVTVRPVGAFKVKMQACCISDLKLSYTQESNRIRRMKYGGYCPRTSGDLCDMMPA